MSSAPTEEFCGAYKGDHSFEEGANSCRCGRAFQRAPRPSAKERAAEGLLPEVGSEWVWEPLKPRVMELVRVTEVRWNGDEWMVQSELLKGAGAGGRYWNDLSRWMEATVFLGER